MLVSTGWRDLVLSRPSFWTWIKVDDTQVDWREKVHVGQTLSRGLPLQIVVRVPFNHIDALSEIFSRCNSLFLDTSTHTPTYVNDSGPHKLERRRKHYQDLHEEIARDLSDLSGFNGAIYIESSNGECFTHSAWTIRERVRKTNSLAGQLQALPMQLITRLFFCNSTHSKNRRFRISSIWPHLFAIPFLRELEICDSFMGVDTLSDILEISLESLQSLKIDCPRSWTSKPPFRDGHKVGLFGLLNCLRAPLLRKLSLGGSPIAILDALPYAHKFRILALELVLRNPIRAIQGLPHNHSPSWYWLNRYAIKFSSPRGSFPVGDTLATLLSLAPEGCSLQLSGDKELMSWIPSSHLSKIKYSTPEQQSEVYEVEYQVSLGPAIGLADGWGVRLQSASIVSHLILDGHFPSFPWDESLRTRAPEHLVLTKNFSTKDSTMEAVWNIVDSAILKSLDIGDCVEANDYFRCPPTSLWFISLTTLRCRADLFLFRTALVTIPQLTDLTLTHPFHLPESWCLKSLICQQSHFSKPITLHFQEFPSPWSSLCNYIISFNQSNIPGFTTVELPGQPHPSLVLLLVQVMRGNPETLKAELVDQMLAKTDLLTCSACQGSGWTCSGNTTCMRFCVKQKIAITGHTFVTENS